jgi:putative peptidoglycan binding protein
MRRAILICTGIVWLAVMADAQIPNNHRKPPQRTTGYSGYRSSSAVRQAVSRRTFSPPRYRQPAFSTARFPEPTLRTMPTRPRMSSSFANRPAMTNTASWRRTRPPVTNDWRQSRFNGRLRLGDSVLNRFTMNDIADRPQTRREFNNKWSDANFRRQARGSFADGSRSAAFWSGRRAAVTNNWRGSEFSGQRYWAFRNYEHQWHDSGWWHNHCGDRLVFVTVYSQPFPFYFDAGYWYPAWGYYPDSYYPYDGPIYGYNDLPPDEVVANVQTQLYNDGYYEGQIDGILGPDTRAAIADYQADHGLAVTAAIDEPTVESLGLI